MTPTPVLPSLPEPFVICYEWKDLRNGTRRSFSAAPYNGMRCSNSLALFTAEQFQAVQREAYELGARSTARPSDDALWDQTLRERDRYHEWADKLAEAISRFIGFDIGEHSNVNNPWARAVDMVPAGTLIEALAQARSTAAQPVEPIGLRSAALALIEKLDALKPHMDAMCLDAHNRGRPYKGPTYGTELEALRAAASGDSTPPSAPVHGDPSGALRPEPEAVGQGRWQPIETAPKDGTTIIVGRDMGDFGFIRGYARFEGAPGSFLSGWISNGFSEIISNLGLAHPTLWQPLPEPPQAASGSRGD